jgi:hypothetical protein
VIGLPPNKKGTKLLPPDVGVKGGKWQENSICGGDSFLSMLRNERLEPEERRAGSGGKEISPRRNTKKETNPKNHHMWG